MWVGLYLFYISLRDIFAIKIINTHNPVAECLNDLASLIIYQSEKVPGIYVHLIILQSQL